MKHVCPVCGYPKLKELPRSRDGGGSYEICPSCGFQFGVSDDDRGFTYEQWREKWRMEGMKWSSHRKVPRGWDPGTQVAKLLIVTMMFFSTVALRAGEQITCKSPDGKFALRQGLNDLNPIHGDAAIVETATKKIAVQLSGDEPYADSKLVWSKDSRRVASFRETTHGGVTRIFFRNGSTFDEIKLAQYPPPQLPELPKADATNSESVRRVEPIRWLESGDLFFEDEVQNKAGARAAVEITFGFEQDNQAIIRKSEPEKMSILDYFLLMPPNTFENPAHEWLYVMRANGNTIDKANGYMSCPGDGAQPEFELALFRYPDGRPLVALCSGELEGTDAVQLQFFELGADGRMQSIGRPILPRTVVKYDPESGYSKRGWQFYLPRHGRTIVVRSEKTKKTLRKFTWDGEKFQEDKRPLLIVPTPHPAGSRSVPR